MPERPWSSLAEPFPPDDVRWHAVGRGEDGSRLRLAPHVAPEALAARLDREVGPDGWSLALHAWGEAGLIAELTVRSVVRSAAVRPVAAPPFSDQPGPHPLDPGAAATGAAFGAAAALFGARPSVRVLDDGWVDADPESGEALHAPEHAAIEAALRDPDAVPPGGAPERAHGATGADPVSDAEPLTGPAPVSDASPAPGSVPPPGSAAPPGPERDDVRAQRSEGKPDGHQVIDRLVERLREEGHGADAARLVTSYGGYGGDADASRELYAKLRALLVERSART